MDATFKISNWLHQQILLLGRLHLKLIVLGPNGGGSIINGDAGFLEVPLGGEADVEIDIIAEQLIPSSFHLSIICHSSLSFPHRKPSRFSHPVLPRPSSFGHGMMPERENASFCSHSQRNDH